MMTAALMSVVCTCFELTKCVLVVDDGFLCDALRQNEVATFVRNLISHLVCLPCIVECAECDWRRTLETLPDRRSAESTLIEQFFKENIRFDDRKAPIIWIVR